MKIVKRVSILTVILLSSSLLLLIAIVAALTASLQDRDDNFGIGEPIGEASVSAECERYRSLVEKYAEKYGMENFVEVIMAIMMQESGGRVPDVMQSSEYAGMAPNTIKNPEVSIDYGVQAVRDAMNTALCTHPSQIDLLKLALQGYNFGSGYVSWAIQNYGGYSSENAELFSEIMAKRYGWSQYGDPKYVDHVFQYYNTDGGKSMGGSGSSVSTNSISNKEAVDTIKMLSKSWPRNLSQDRKNVILKGASLIGKVTYSMGAGRDDPTDNPIVKDCSSFVAWAFQKAGFTDVPYASTTGTYISAENFRSIGSNRLQPGDIGLINYISEGGSNHVGIYMGVDTNGRAMWLHCTSHKSEGSSISNGPRISYYGAFTIFYQYTGFKS